MGFLEVLIAILIVINIFLIIRWLLGVLKIAIPQDLLAVLAIILLLLILLGKVHIGF